MLWHLLCAALAPCLLLGAGSSVLAQAGDASATAEADRGGRFLLAEARERYELASNLYHQGRFDEAATEFQRAYELSGRAELLHNVYLCHRDAGRVREAAVALRGYLEGAETIHARELMESRLRALELQLEQMPPETEAEAAPEAQPPQPETPPADEAPPPPDLSGESNPGPHPEAPSQALPWALTIGGAVIALAGVGLAVAAGSLHGELSDACDPSGACPSNRAADIDRLEALSLGADVTLLVGIATASVGLALLVLGGDADAPAQDEGRASLALGCLPGGCALALRGAF